MTPPTVSDDQKSNEPIGDELAEAKRYIELLKRFAHDDSVSDAELRGFVKWIAWDQRLTPAEIAHGQELARKFGWDLGRKSE